jgi:hypothetical protein
VDNFDSRNSRNEFASLSNFQRDNKALDFIVDKVEIVDSDFRLLTSERMNILRITKTKRKWHEIILWWEIRRIPYNIIMYFIGLLSFQIGYVTIPLVDIIIGLGLNVLYTLGWIIELLFTNRLKDKDRKIKYPRYAFLSYLTFSTLIVFAIPILLLIR